MSYLPDEPRYEALNPDADAEMLWRVLDSVKQANNGNKNSNPVWNQENWAVGYVSFIDNENTNWCGSSFCYAGWTAFLDDTAKIVINKLCPVDQVEYGSVTDCVAISREEGENLNISDIELNAYPMYQSDHFRTVCIVDGEGFKPLNSDEYPHTVSISTWAQNRLGLSEVEGDILFHAGNSLQDLEDIVRVVTGYTEPLDYATIEKWKTKILYSNVEH